MRSSGCRSDISTAQHTLLRGVESLSAPALRARRLPRGAPALVLAALIAHASIGRPLPAQSEPAEPTAQEPITSEPGVLRGRIGDSLTIVGVVTSQPQRSRGSLRYIRVQDGGVAVRVVARRGAGLIDSLDTGTLVRVRGTHQSGRGRPYVLATLIERIGIATTPAAVPTDLISLLSERYVDQRVRVRGVLRSYVVAGDDARADRDFELHDGSARIAVRVPDFRDWVHAEQLLHGGPVEIVAFVDRTATDDADDPRYRLQVADLNDILFVPRPAYAEFAVSLLVGVFILLLFYVIRRRDDAERRATEIQRLYADLRQADDALRESVGWNQQTFDSVAVGIAHVAHDGRWLRMNPQLCRMLGYTQEELLGLTVADVTHPADHAAQKESRVALWEGRIPDFTVEKRYVRKDGEVIWAEVTVSVTGDPDSGNRRFITVAADITQRKRLEAQLRQGQKMEAVGRLAGGVAHDFNNLLTVITSYSSMLLQDQEVNSNAAADLREIEAAAQRAAGLTRQLLAYSRQQLLQLRVVDLNAIAIGITPMLGRLIGEDIRISTNLEPHLGTILADSGQLEQVIMNLAVNARDAMTGGGTITIRTENVELGPWMPQAQQGEITPGWYSVLSFSDTGCGMDAATSAQIFEPFFTTKGPGSGTGLGLATVYGIVKQSGGFIWVDSEVGKGTTFQVYLPHAATPVESGSDPLAEEPHRARGTETILLVEDDDSLRRLVIRMLSRRGYSVVEARNGSEALKLVNDTIDLVVTDVVMPVMSGVQLAAKIREINPELRVIYTSGYTDDDIIRRGLLDADMAFVQKPFTADVLTRKVREVLDGSERAEAGAQA